MKMREIMTLCEAQEPPFIEHLFDAVNAAQVGFYFEEGGCYGMALAIYERFRALGLPAELVVAYDRDGPTHALVRSGGKLYDYEGVASGWQTGDLRVVTPAQLIAISEDREDPGSDDIHTAKQEADGIIDNAIELAEGGNDE